MSILELKAQNTFKGKMTTSLLLGSTTTQALVSLKAIKVINTSSKIIEVATVLKTASNLSKITRAGMLIGAATAEFGVGFAIMGVMTLIDILGSAYLKEINRPWLLKALEYCYFGTHPYGEGG